MRALRAPREWGSSELAKYSGPEAYSYVFDGQWGYLDHALGSASLVQESVGATDLHINADEPSVLDYNTNFKSAGQLSSLYSADAYRISDHDPVRVGLSPRAPLAVYGALLERGNRLQPGSALPLVFAAGESGSAKLVVGSPSTVAVDCTTLAPTGALAPLPGTARYGSVHASQYVRVEDRQGRRRHLSTPADRAGRRQQLQQRSPLSLTTRGWQFAVASGWANHPGAAEPAAISRPARPLL